ncbi:hypothetical protein [Novosphingobium sp. ZW T3_23]|uniref:hypothetical protein n=1 Tax=Novosphingobium sp. ZW T3_23 TaxID=3378084 RepID=UPI0038555EB0
MIGKIFGAIVGNKAAKHVKGVSGTSGTLLGIAAPVVVRRLGPLGVIAAAAGAYAYKKYSDRREVEKTRGGRSSGLAEPTRTQA